MTAKEAGGIPPRGQDFNGIFFAITEILRYMQAGGMPTYSAAMSTAIGGYPLGALLLKSNGLGFWRNTTANNTSNPDSGGAGWSSDGASSCMRGLKISSSGLSPLVSISFDMISLDSTSGIDSVVVGQASLSASVATSGSNGIDTGTLAASTWYSVWVIYNGSAVASLLSLSATTPTMPAGYTFRRRVGWIRTDSSVNKYPIAFTQYNAKVTWKLYGSAYYPLMASGTVGTITSAAYSPVSVSVDAFIPPTAMEIILKPHAATTGACCAVTPGAAGYGGFDDLDKPPLIASEPDYWGGYYEMALESRAVYFASSGTTGRLFCIGWEDTL
jgi:hypothetical protein